MSREKNILMTGARAPGTVELARLLKTQGHRIWVMDSFKRPLASFTNCIESHIHCPRPRQQPHEYSKFLLSTIDKYKIDIVIPTYEETYYVAKIKEQIETKAKLWCSPLEQLNTFHNKFEFIKLAEKLELNVPKTVVIEAVDLALEKIKLKEKIVLKPTYSRFGEEVIILPQKQEDVISIDIGPEKKWVVQEYLSGKTFCSYALAHQGKILAYSVYPGEIISHNASVAFRHVEHPEINQWVETFVAKTKFTGQISFDFIETDYGVKAIECNPRMTSGIHLFNDNVEFAKLWVDESAGVVTPHKDKSMMLTLLVLFAGGSLLKTPKKWGRTLVGAKDVVFSLKDPGPLLGQFYAFFSLCFLAIKKKMPPNQVSTWDIEWNGENL